MLNVSYLESQLALVKVGFDLRDLVLMNSSATRQALLAYLLSTRPHGLSRQQAAWLVGANLTYTVALAGLTPEQRAQVAFGELKLSHIVNRKGRFHKNMKTTACPSLAEQFQAASPAERLEAARAVGVDLIWDQMVVPVCAESEPSIAAE